MFAHFNLILLSTSHVLTSGYTSDMRRLKHLKVFMWITHIWSSKFSDLLLKSFLSSGNHLLSCVDRVDAVGSCTIWNCTVDNTWIIFKIFNSWLVFKLFFFAFFMCTFSCPIDACLVVFKIFLSMASEYRLSDAWVRTVEFLVLRSKMRRSYDLKYLMLIHTFMVFKVLWLLPLPTPYPDDTWLCSFSFVH